jgi:hypothetical protein
MFFHGFGFDFESIISQFDSCVGSNKKKGTSLVSSHMNLSLKPHPVLALNSRYPHNTNFDLRINFVGYVNKPTKLILRSKLT